MARFGDRSERPLNPAFAAGGRSAFIPALVGGFAVVLMFAVALASAGWNPTLFLTVGEDATAIREFTEERLGDLVLARKLGHDGRFFFVQANDPWVGEPGIHAVILDRPIYRSQRMLYPVLASGAGLFGPGLIVWAMLVVNLLALAAGTIATSTIARSMGMSTWWGLAFALNLGFLWEIRIGGAGVLAGAAAFWGVALILRGNWQWAITCLALAVLTREAMLIVAAGIAAWIWTDVKNRRTAVLVVGIPATTLAIWGAYLRFRIPQEYEGDGSLGVGLPLQGLVIAFRDWVSEDLESLVVGIAIALVIIAFAYRVSRSRELVGWAFVGFAFLAPFLTYEIWRSSFDISRALAPALTAYVLILFQKPREPHLTPEVRSSTGSKTV